MLRNAALRCHKALAAKLPGDMDGYSSDEAPELSAQAPTRTLASPTSFPTTPRSWGSSMSCFATPALGSERSTISGLESSSRTSSICTPRRCLSFDTVATDSDHAEPTHLQPPKPEVRKVVPNIQSCAYWSEYHHRLLGPLYAKLRGERSGRPARLFSSCSGLLSEVVFFQVHGPAHNKRINK